MNVKRIVVGSQSIFFPEGAAFTVPSAGTAGVAAKPDVTDPAWVSAGAIKWKKKPTGKTETYMEAAPGAYVATDEINLSRGVTYVGSLEKQSNLAYQLALQARTNAGANLPNSPTAGGQYNPLAGGPAIKGWLHVQEYDQNNVLVNTVDLWVSIKAANDTNNDDKAAETPIEATVLWSSLNSGTLS